MKKEDKPALLFDLGGVIMDIERDRCVAALKCLGMERSEDYLGIYGQKGPFLELEEGKITPGQFRDRLRELIPAEVTDRQLDEAFCEFLVGIPVERLRKLQELHTDYRIYMLSNTNKIMWDSVIADEFRKDGHDINFYFDGCATSFEAKVCKPEPEIFRYLLDRFNLEASDVIFFDDSESNCEAAAKLGFRTVWVAPGKEFYNLIEL